MNNQSNIVKWYYDTGELEGEMPYKNGEVHGIVKFYYKSGKLKLELPYVEGIKKGVEKQYSENGNVRVEIDWNKNETAPKFEYEKQKKN